MNVRPLSPAERSENGDEGGLVVGSVGGAAAEAGIRPGDVVLAVVVVVVLGVHAASGKMKAKTAVRFIARAFSTTPARGEAKLRQSKPENRCVLSSYDDATTTAGPKLPLLKGRIAILS